MKLGTHNLCVHSPASEWLCVHTPDSYGFVYTRLLQNGLLYCSLALTTFHTSDILTFYNMYVATTKDLWDKDYQSMQIKYTFWKSFTGLLAQVCGTDGQNGSPSMWDR